MKTKISMLVALLFTATISTQAQQMQHKTIEERVKSAMDKISDPIKLDKDQQDKTTFILTDYYTSQEKMREEAKESGNRPDRSVMEKRMSDRDERLKAIFTDDQYKKFKDDIESTLRPQRQQQMQGVGNS